GILAIPLSQEGESGQAKWINLLHNEESETFTLPNGYFSVLSCRQVARSNLLIVAADYFQEFSTNERHYDGSPPIDFFVLEMETHVWRSQFRPPKDWFLDASTGDIIVSENGWYFAAIGRHAGSQLPEI